MRLSRRAAITGAVAVMGGAAVAYAGYIRSFTTLYSWLKVPVLAPTPTGRLSDKAVQTLLASVEGLIGRPVEMDHYADFFRWYAENLKGYSRLYERFAVIVSRTARQTAGRDFTQLDPKARRKILDAAFKSRRRGVMGSLRTGLFDRDWQLFDLYIIRPVTRLFAHTDAWRLAGYSGWPATPRGLDRYTQPN